MPARGARSASVLARTACGDSNRTRGRPTESFDKGRLLTCLIGWLSLDEAFAAKHLSDMGEETDDFTVFTWPLKDYRRMDKKALSPEFTCGGHKWYVEVNS